MARRRGHGTYSEGGKLIAAVAGVVERLNKLISVRPLRSRCAARGSGRPNAARSRPSLTARPLAHPRRPARPSYVGNVGDVVVGRVVDVGAKRWRVDIGAPQVRPASAPCHLAAHAPLLLSLPRPQHAVLMLSSIILPGGEQRRRTAEDQMQMRGFFREHDLVSVRCRPRRSVLTCSLGPTLPRPATARRIHPFLPLARTRWGRSCSTPPPSPGGGAEPDGGRHDLAAHAVAQVRPAGERPTCGRPAATGPPAQAGACGRKAGIARARLTRAAALRVAAVRRGRDHRDQWLYLAHRCEAS